MAEPVGSDFFDVGFVGGDGSAERSVSVENTDGLYPGGFRIHDFPATVTEGPGVNPTLGVQPIAPKRSSPTPWEKTGSMRYPRPRPLT